jgi:hypothetical protein
MNEWAFPEPVGLEVIQRTPDYFSIHWNIVTGPEGQTPDSYTVVTYKFPEYEMVDSFQTKFLHASIPSTGVRLHLGEYKVLVWANGSPLRGHHAEIVTMVNPLDFPEMP